MNHTRTVIALAALALLAACAKQTLPGVVDPASQNGFLMGLVHGFIFPVAWFLSLVMHDVSVYAVPNTGFGYNFGYFLGIVVFGVGARGGHRVVYRTRTVRTPRGGVVEGRIIREEEL